jgi:hypothetical protein
VAGGVFNVSSANRSGSEVRRKGFESFIARIPGFGWWPFEQFDGHRAVWDPLGFLGKRFPA